MFKVLKASDCQPPIEFKWSDTSAKEVYQLLKLQPLTSKEKNDIVGTPVKEKPQLPPFRISVGTLTHSYVTVPPRPTQVTPQIAKTRHNLPIASYREQLLQLIEDNLALVVCGETGSGKTTQVPQYIMEHCTERNRPCRIICTQPRRLSAISVAERVCVERGETVGQTVGYQIRLESKTSPISNLIYCTNGVLLRCLMGEKADQVFKDITHVIVDEVSGLRCRMSRQSNEIPPCF